MAAPVVVSPAELSTSIGRGERVGAIGRKAAANSPPDVAASVDRDSGGHNRRAVRYAGDDPRVQGGAVMDVEACTPQLEAHDCPGEWVAPVWPPGATHAPGQRRPPYGAGICGGRATGSLIGRDGKWEAADQVVAEARVLPDDAGEDGGDLGIDAHRHARRRALRWGAPEAPDPGGTGSPQVKVGRPLEGLFQQLRILDPRDAVHTRRAAHACQQVPRARLADQAVGPHGPLHDAVHCTAIEEAEATVRPQRILDPRQVRWHCGAPPPTFAVDQHPFLQAAAATVPGRDLQLARRLVELGSQYTPGVKRGVALIVRRRANWR